MIRRGGVAVRQEKGARPGEGARRWGEGEREGGAALQWKRGSCRARGRRRRPGRAGHSPTRREEGGGEALLPGGEKRERTVDDDIRRRADVPALSPHCDATGLVGNEVGSDPKRQSPPLLSQTLLPSEE